MAYSDGVTPGVSYAYDAAGLLTSTTDGTGTTSYTNNADGQPTTVANGAGQSVSYATYPNGDTAADTLACVLTGPGAGGPDGAAADGSGSGSSPDANVLCRLRLGIEYVALV